MDQDLCASLIKWLQTFELNAPHRTAEEISDGVAMAQALNQIAPEWFNSSFISKIKTDVGSNWRLKVSNLRKILEYIIDYYQEVINQHLLNFDKPDVTKIAEKCDRSELGRLLQLLVGCAVNCERKQEYITVIMGMEEIVQRVIMQAIQELENGCQLSLVVPEEPQVQKLLSELQKAIDERDLMNQKCHELDFQVGLLQDEKLAILQEKKRLEDRLQELESSKLLLGASGSLGASDGSSNGNAKYEMLRRQHDELKEELFRMEAARDDLRLRNDALERQTLVLQIKVDDLVHYEADARHMKDEIDVLRESVEKMSKLESTIESYKRKLDELSDLKRQNKLLEEKNGNYVQQTLKMEEELARQSIWKQQVDIYKKQVADLHLQLNEETKRADKEEFDHKKAQEKLSALIREKERLIAERDLLKETNEELKCAQLSANDNLNRSEDLLESPMTLSDLRDRLARLAEENRMLKMRQKESEQLAVVQGLLDDANGQTQLLTKQNREANRRILELESKIEELQVESGKTCPSEERQEEHLKAQSRELSLEVEQLRQKVETQEEQLEEANRKITSLREIITRKDVELQQAEEKYKKCVEKAKTVITSLEPRPNAELAMLRNQLMQQKNSALQQAEKAGHEAEVKLITSAYQILARQRHKEAVDQRLADLSRGQSFLTRQRQAVPRKMSYK